MTVHTCSYPFDGRENIVHVEAADAAEVSRHLRAIGMTGTVEPDGDTCRYRLDGREHRVRLDAYDPQRAVRRLRAIGTTAQVDGVLIAEIPVEGDGGWLTQLRRALGRLP
jgi:hypothetical protein